MTTSQKKTRVNFRLKQEIESQRVMLNQLTMEKQELESTLFVSLNEIHRLRSIVEEQSEQISRNRAFSVVKTDALRNKKKKKSFQDVSNAVSESSKCIKKKTTSNARARRNTPQVEMFQCEKCEYVAKRKYTLKIHREFHCSNNSKHIMKDSKCRICQKVFTHNGLRSHLSGFVKAEYNGRKPRGPHASISSKNHREYLNEINLKNRLNDH